MGGDFGFSENRRTQTTQRSGGSEIRRIREPENERTREPEGQNMGNIFLVR